MIKMEDKVKDKITGFTGIVTARCEYMNGCIQFEVTARLLNGKILKPVWMDEQRLEKIVSKKKAKKKRKEKVRPGARYIGGPQDTPTGMNTPPDSHEDNEDAGYGMMT